MAGKAPAPKLRRCYVIDEDPALAARMPAAVRPVARQLATAPVVRVPEGEQPLAEWFGRVEHEPGLLVLRGVVAREVHVADRTATELVGPGDLLRPWDLDRREPVPVTIVWRVVEALDLALLDDTFVARTRAWPEIAAELLGRLEHRAEGLAVQRAIAAHPRVDMRVAMLLWHLAGRWGMETGNGSIRIDLPLTHKLLGELAGAERPSVSHALSRLGKAGLVTRDGHELTLHGTPAEHEKAALRPLP